MSGRETVTQGSAWSDALSRAQRLAERIEEGSGGQRQVRGVSYNEDTGEALWAEDSKADAFGVYFRPASAVRSGEPIWWHVRDFTATAQKVVLLRKDGTFLCQVPDCAIYIPNPEDALEYRAIDAWGKLHAVKEVAHRVWKVVEED